MKRSILLSIVTGFATLAAPIQATEIYNNSGNKLDLYGRIKTVHYVTSNNSQSYVNFGFKGETKISDQLTGYGRWEAEFSTNNMKNPAQQRIILAFAGLEMKNFGSFDYGHNLATYRNTNFFGIINGLDMTLQYQGGYEDPNTQKRNGYSLSSSLSYDFSGSDFVISGEYTSSKRTENHSLQTHSVNSKPHAWATSLKYDANDAYIETFYSETYNMTPIPGGFAKKTENFKAILQYQFDFGLRPSLGYVLSKGQVIENNLNNNEELINYIDVGAMYHLKENMSAFFDYKVNQLAEDNKLGISSNDVIAIGLTYQF